MYYNYIIAHVFGFCYKLIATRYICFKRGLMFGLMYLGNVLTVIETLSLCMV